MMTTVIINNNVKQYNKIKKLVITLLFIVSFHQFYSHKQDKLLSLTNNDDGPLCWKVNSIKYFLATLCIILIHATPYNVHPIKKKPSH